MRGLLQGLRTTLLAGACAVALAAAPAQAGFVDVRDGNGGNVFNGGPGSANVNIIVDGNGMNVAAGAFALQYRLSTTADWVNFLTYCLEPDELLGIASNGASYTGNLAGSPAATAEYAAVATALARFNATWFEDSLTSALKSAAFQVALWEIAYDPASDLGAGNFRLNTAQQYDDVRNQANLYLNPANWGQAEPLDIILRAGNQDLIVQVPEPATLALFGLGVVALGIARRRFKAG